MSINDVTIRADGVDHAIVAAMRAAANGTEGIVETKAHPTMRIENMRTGEVTVVSIDKDYKVVKIHELDGKVQTTGTE
jgi:hypothetical protein